MGHTAARRVSATRSSAQQLERWALVLLQLELPPQRRERPDKAWRAAGRRGRTAGSWCAGEWAPRGPGEGTRPKVSSGCIGAELLAQCHSASPGSILGALSWAPEPMFPGIPVLRDGSGDLAQACGGRRRRTSRSKGKSDPAGYSEFWRDRSPFHRHTGGVPSPFNPPQLSHL